MNSVDFKTLLNSLENEKDKWEWDSPTYIKRGGVYILFHFPFCSVGVPIKKVWKDLSFFQTWKVRKALNKIGNRPVKPEFSSVFNQSMSV